MLRLVALSWLTCCAAYAIHYVFNWYKLRRTMPPGPLGLPWLGNRHELPAIKPWKKFAEWNALYGSVTSIFLGTTPVIILGTAQPAWDLLEKRSDIYSSRPRFVVAGEILSNNMRGLMLPNNDVWRRWRKVLHLGFHSRQAASYNEIQSMESKVVLKQLLDDPSDFEKHFQRFAGSVAVSVTYGRRIKTSDDWIPTERETTIWQTSLASSEKWIILVKHCLTLKSSIPGKYLVESWPWLLKLPRPLQWFRREPERRKKEDIAFLTYLLRQVKMGMGSGTMQDCLASQCLNNIEQLGMDEVELAYAISSPFGAGIETSVTLQTVATTTTLIMAMLHYPEVQEKAQAELDKVIGHGRMPEYEDRENLPYINAVINEALRWRPVAVLGGQPHAVTEDDVYNGMFIPKGSTIFANLYGIMRDPGMSFMFPDPEAFKPERFIDTTNPRLKNFDLPFGFGRRSCPGIHLARNSLYINVARLLWGFQIKPALDEKGNEIMPDCNAYTNGFNSRPVPFPCRFIPRSPKITLCIQTEWEAVRPRLELSR
ncbi:hypothetical protein D9619_009793 [Psilocybe cf. subviscida]|uniref:Cytochrome P450 n=1 Tax=Psilocybe cf. subviscida TaxID=2480587 RepID=A0A8H5BLH4_9AGAR|nr:hypothetical protein D9619_009793 [Psilocybe cf. subviscida]